MENNVIELGEVEDLSGYSVGYEKLQEEFDRSGESYEILNRISALESRKRMRKLIKDIYNRVPSREVADLCIEDIKLEGKFREGRKNVLEEAEQN